MLSISDTGTDDAGGARRSSSRSSPPSSGTGTGLGLATVHGIVTRRGGVVNVYSEVGQGTAFKIYFPRCEALDVVAAPARPVVRARGGTQTVLVVEDAGGLRELTRRLLQRHGYTVITAANADEALALFDSGRSIDVVLTDVVMPGGNGPELVKQLTERQPSLKVIYMSGYTEESTCTTACSNRGSRSCKPFTSDGWAARSAKSSISSRSRSAPSATDKRRRSPWPAPRSAAGSTG